MGIEKIVTLLNGKEKIAVLNEDGTVYSIFDINHYPYESFNKNNSVIFNTRSGLFCYDYFGNEKWRVSECYSGTVNPIGYDNNAFYISHSLLRSEVDLEKDCEECDIFGTIFYSLERDQTDLWVAKVNHNGKVLWNKYISEKNQASDRPLSNGKKLVIPFSDKEVDGFAGFYILDAINGNVLSTHKKRRIMQRPIGLIGNRLVYNLYDEEKNQYFQEVYDIDENKLLKKIAYQKKGYFVGIKDENQVHCYSLNNKIISSSDEYIRIFNCKNFNLKDYPIINYTLTVIKDNIIVDVAPEEFLQTNRTAKIKPGVITSFTANMKVQWKYQVPNSMKGMNYGFYKVNNGILLSGYYDIEKVDINGNLIWKRGPIKINNIDYTPVDVSINLD